MLLGIAEGKLDLEARSVETEDLFRCQFQVDTVKQHPFHRLQVGTAG